MGFPSVGAYVDAQVSLGQHWYSQWQKTTGAVAYVVNRWYDLSMTQGTPRLNVFPGGLLEGTKLWYKSTGNIYHTRNALVAPQSMHIARAGAFSVVATVCPCVLLLCDYLKFYPLIDMDDDSYQEFDNVALPALPRYPTGVGVKMFFVTTADIGAAPASVYVTYTNTDGAERQLGCQVDLCASAITGQITHSGSLVNNFGPFLPLAPGDKGVRSVQGVQLSSGSGGGYACLVLVKPIMSIPIYSVANTFYYATEKDLYTHAPSLPAVHCESFLQYLIFTSQSLAAGSEIRGWLDFVWN